MSPLEAFAALNILLVMTVLCGPGGARRSAVTLAANWTSCTAYVALSGNFTPWAWFWAMDFLCAAALLLHPVSKWQRWLAYSYMLQFGFHAAFGFAQYMRGHGASNAFTVAGGDPLQYLGRLDTVLIVQLGLVAIWTGGHGLYRLCRAHRWRSVLLNKILGWTDR